MKKLTVLLMSLLCAGTAAAQENTYFPTAKGAELTYKYYNARGKALKDDYKNERWLKFTVEDVWPQDNGMVINVAVDNENIQQLAKSKNMKPAAESLSYGDVKIEGDTVTLDNMQWLVAAVPEFLMMSSGGRNNDGPQFSVELAALSRFPREMTVGQELPDEDMFDAKWGEVLTEEQIAEREASFKEMQVEMQSMGFGRMGGGGFSNFSSGFSFPVKASTRNRRVEAREKVDTPAGTFDCYKITYELVRPTDGFGMGMATMSVSIDGGMVIGGPGQQAEPEGEKYADWISPEVGLVKREKYNRRGKLEERMILETYTTPQ